MRKHFICIMVIAQGTEHRVQSTGHGAQGTIEYLIIIAIVIVIALVVVSLLTGMLSPAQGVGQSINKVGNWSNSIALTETSVTPDGNYLVRLANNSGEEFTVSNVKIGDTNANYSQDLFQGNAQNFVIDSSDACSTGDGVTKTVTITYVSKNGITKTEVYPADTYFSCENYTVSLLADQCEVCSSASYDGNANDANVLAGYSFYSNNDTLLYGTIDTITPGASSTLFTSGYYASDFNLSVIDIDLNADNISSGVDIFGITGTASAGGGGGDPGYYQLGTGQTTCYDEIGDPRSCSGTGEDGEIYGSSYAHSWSDNGDGTVSDTTSGLMWQKADNGSTITWQAALTYCNGLILATHSDWHLPNKKEILDMFNDQTGTCQSVFTGCSNYWSSTSPPSSSVNAYYFYCYGLIFNDYKDYDDVGRARCVRFES